MILVLVVIAGYLVWLRSRYQPPVSVSPKPIASPEVIVVPSPSPEMSATPSATPKVSPKASSKTATSGATVR